MAGSICGHGLLHAAAEQGVHVIVAISARVGHKWAGIAAHGAHANVVNVCHPSFAPHVGQRCALHLGVHRVLSASHVDIHIRHARSVIKDLDDGHV